MFAQVCLSYIIIEYYPLVVMTTMTLNPTVFPVNNILAFLSAADLLVL